MPNIFRAYNALFLFLALFWSSLTQGQNLDSLARQLSDLVFDYDPQARSLVDSLEGSEIGLQHTALQHTLGNFYYLEGIINRLLNVISEP